jgi:hypothetical protein
MHWKKRIRVKDLLWYAFRRFSELGDDREGERERGVARISVLLLVALIYVALCRSRLLTQINDARRE